MSRVRDATYLRNEQYHSSSNLERRIALHKRFSVNPYSWQRWVFDQLSLPPNGRLLELGCGSGALWEDNLERSPPAWEITLSDFSIGMVSQTQKRLAGQMPKAHFQAIDAQAIPYALASFDRVIANHMLYHVPRREQALAEIRRILRPDGYLYATTGGERHMAELYELVQMFDPKVAADGWYIEPIDFRLENGRAQLAPWFNSVELRRYENSLVVTEALPLVDYILSTVRLRLGEERRADLMQFIQTQMDASGGTIRITIEGGMFIAGD